MPPSKALNPNFFVEIQALACSLNRTNPGLPLVVLTVAGDLRPKTEAAVREVAHLQHVPDFYFPNNVLRR